MEEYRDKVLNAILKYWESLDHVDQYEIAEAIEDVYEIVRAIEMT
jgi:hypothetical protein